MKILFYLHNLWNISATTRLAVDLASELQKKYGVDIDFVVNKRIHNDLKDLPFNLFVLNRKGEIGKALGLKDIILRNKYDLVLSYMLTQNIVLSITKAIVPSNIKTVFLGSVHNSDNYMKNREFYKIPYRLLMKKLYENLDGIIVVSNAVKEDINRAYLVSNSKIKVIYNYIDTNRINSLAEEPLTPEEKEMFSRPVVINVGRMEVQKGQEYLIKALPIIKEKEPDVLAVIVGDGSLKEPLEKLAEKMGLKNSVSFLGYRDNPFKYMKHSKVFAFPSLWEGVGNVVLEAQTLGLPVVAFESQGGHVDVLKNSGILVPEKDYIKLGQRIADLLTDEEERKKYSCMSSQNAKNYTVEKKAEEYYNYFMEKIKEKNG
ncbi:glycosyltransferase [Persephonella sp.]